MRRLSECRGILAALALGWALTAIAPPKTFGQGHAHHFFGHREQEECYEIATVQDLAMLIDRLDKELFRHGKVAVKSPDVWGQNRMTQYRAEFEDQMKAELGNFQLMIQSYLRRSDAAALTSATTVAAAIQPGAAAGGTATASTTAVTMPTPGIPGDLVANANTLIGQMTQLLTPSDLANLSLANAGSRSGIGLEPTIVLDQKARYLNHLHELRRINAGDDATDAPGYGLYLMRMPVSLLPGPESQRGKGASVTVEAKYEPTTDLLPVTFRNVVILDATYQLKDFLIKGLHRTIDLSKDPAPSAPRGARPPRGAGVPGMAPQAAAPLIPTVGPGKTAISSTEIIDIYGRNNLRKVVEEIQEDQKDWYRHDPSVVTWLLGELTTAHNFFREEARRGNPLFQPPYIQMVGDFAFQRRYADLAKARLGFLKSMIMARKGVAVPDDENAPTFYDNVSVIDVLTFGLLVQSYYLDRTIKIDMEVMARRKGCTCGDPWGLILYEPYPSEEARAAFASYVACKWPLHVFAVDPAVDQQNQLDLFSQRSELQLALAMAVASGAVNFNNATTYARRLETDLATIALNRTAVGFGAGDTTFGWRFYPRVQTPPTQSNPARILGLLVNNGPGRNYDLRNRRIEPGPRECVALVVAPNFVPQIRLTSVTNWFDLTGHHAEQTIETTDMVQMAHKLQKARAALDRLCDTHLYPPDQIALLSDRLAQLEALLPMRGHQVSLPFEGDLTASEIFTSSSSGLAPRLLTWYGEPPKIGTTSSIFIVGTGFSVHELKTIAGGLTLADTDLISRNVLRIEIPPDARPIVTNPNIDGERRLVFDVHVASPNGVSNHLLVEADPADQPPAAAPPKSAYTISARTPVLNVVYNAKDASGRFRPNNGQVDGSTPRIDILWNDPTGVAPRQAQVTLNLHYKGGMISIPLARPITLSGTDRGFYTMTGADLALVAQEYVEQLDSLDNFTLDNPLPQLTTDSIDITPVQGGTVLDTQTVQTNNQLMISPTPIGAIPAAGAAPAPAGPAVAPPSTLPPALPPAAAPAAPAAPPSTLPPALPPAGPAASLRSRVPRIEAEPVAPTEVGNRSAPVIRVPVAAALTPVAGGPMVPAAASLPILPGNVSVPATVSLPSATGNVSLPATVSLPSVPGGVALPSLTNAWTLPAVAPAPVVVSPSTSTTAVTPPAVQRSPHKPSVFSRLLHRPRLDRVGP